MLLACGVAGLKIRQKKRVAQLGRNAVKDQQLADSNWQIAIGTWPNQNTKEMAQKDLFFSPRSSVLIRGKVFGLVLLWPIASC
jgi:hypothetical protein